MKQKNLKSLKAEKVNKKYNIYDEDEDSFSDEDDDLMWFVTYINVIYT